MSITPAPLTAARVTALAAILHAAQHGQQIARLVDEHTGRVLYGTARRITDEHGQPYAPNADLESLYLIVTTDDPTEGTDDRAWPISALVTEHHHGHFLTGPEADTGR